MGCTWLPERIISPFPRGGGGGAAPPPPPAGGRLGETEGKTGGEGWRLLLGGGEGRAVGAGGGGGGGAGGGGGGVGAQMQDRGYWEGGTGELI